MLKYKIVFLLLMYIYFMDFDFIHYSVVLSHGKKKVLKEMEA